MYGRIGTGDQFVHLTPKHLEAFDGFDVLQISAGGTHSLVIAGTTATLMQYPEQRP
jgi:hypothetical protein